MATIAPRNIAFAASRNLLAIAGVVDPIPIAAIIFLFPITRVGYVGHDITTPYPK